jgi:hypothetical protein
MKIYVAAFALCLIGPVSAATDDGTLACRLVDRSLVEHLSGDTIQYLDADSLNICTGFCASMNGSICRAQLRKDPYSKNTWTVWLYQPPFEKFDFIANGFDDRATRRMVEWQDARAVWEYRADQMRGILTVWTNDHSVMIIVTREHDARSSEASLSAAAEIAARALELFKGRR